MQSTLLPEHTKKSGALEPLHYKVEHFVGVMLRKRINSQVTCTALLTCAQTLSVSVGSRIHVLDAHMQN